MKLYYFNFPGRAEASRIMLRARGVPFQDVRFERDEWLATYKAVSPTGQTPFLVTDDGMVLAQTAAIDEYVGTLTGFYPASDALQASKCWMISECIREVWESFMATFAIKDPKEMADARKPLFQEGGASAAKLSVLEAMVAKRSTAFFLSDKPSVADINIFVQVSLFSSGLVPGVDRSVFERCPELVKLRDQVASLPDIAKQYADCASHPHLAAFMP